MSIVFILIAIFAILLVLPVMLPSTFSMSRSIEIGSSASQVFSKLTSLNEYVKWNPFPEGDPTNQTTVNGEGVGSFLVWKGKKTGEGRMTIINIEPVRKIGVKMEFYKPMRGEGMVHWIVSEKAESKSELIWSFEQELPYFNRYFGLIMESMMGKHFERGLENYKAIVESQK